MAELIDYLKALPNLASVAPDRIDQAHESHAFVATAKLGGKLAMIRVSTDPSFPLRKPSIYLLWPRKRLVPHVMRNGFVCYAPDEGLLLDQDNPGGVLASCVNKALSTLELGLSGEAQDDLFNEFEAYWAGLDGNRAAISFITLSDSPKYISVGKQADTGLILLADTDDRLRAMSRRFYRRHTLDPHLSSGVYVPLVEPFLPNPFSNTDVLRDAVFQRLSVANRDLLKELLKDRNLADGSTEVLVLSMPTPSGKTAVAGITLSELRWKALFSRKAGPYPHPLKQGGVKCRLSTFSLGRHDPEYVLPRGGGNTGLAGRVLLIGCGSVGGHVAEGLARAGVTDLALVDPDDLQVGNIHRHVLGVSHLYEGKAKALKEELEWRYPFISVTPFKDRFENLVSSKQLDLTTFDLIVAATGDATLDLYINRQICSLRNRPCVVFTWLEPLGIGGHALGITPGGRGCLECLYRDPDDPQTPLYNRASFAAEGQYFGRSILACGDIFTPYSSVDAAKTSAMATELAVDILLGREQASPLLSWKGSTDKLLESGFRLSPRYQQTEEDLFRLRYDYAQEDCPICGKGHQ